MMHNKGTKKQIEKKFTINDILNVYIGQQDVKNRRGRGMKIFFFFFFFLFL